MQLKTSGHHFAPAPKGKLKTSSQLTQQEWSMFNLSCLSKLTGCIATLQILATTVQAAGLLASDGVPNDALGFSASRSGNLSLVGALDPGGFGNITARGSAYVFRSLDTSTGIVTDSVKLLASDAADYEHFGYSVSLSGSIGLVGAELATVGFIGSSGAAYLYRNLGTAFGTVTQNAKLAASDGLTSDYFGGAVALSGSVGLAGAFGATVNGNLQQGAAYVFRDLGTATGTVNQNAKLTASDGAEGDSFGFSASVDGSIGLVGAPHGLSTSTSQGAAYVFRNLGTASGIVTQNVKLAPTDSAHNSYFGYYVSLSGSIGLVGTIQEFDLDTGMFFGQNAAYIFRNLDTATGTVTQNVKLLASGGSFEGSASLSGNTALVGGHGDMSGTGAAYLYRNLDTAVGTITQNVRLSASDGGSLDYFGYSVSLDGDQFTISAPRKNSNRGKAYTGTVSSVTTLDGGNTSRTIDGISFVSQDDWIIGETANGNQVTLAVGNTGNVTAAGKRVYVGKNAGSNNNRLVIQGSLSATQINVGATGNTGNTLQLGTSGSVDRISNTTNLMLTGGTLSMEGISSSTETLGALNLGGNSFIDFGSGTGDTLIFSGLTLGGFTLSIYNWSGSPYGLGQVDPGTPSTQDRLIFTNDVSGQPVSLVNFYSGGSGSPLIGSGTLVSYSALSGSSEIVPLPEPGTGAILAGGFAMLAGTYRRRHNAAR